MSCPATAVSRIALCLGVLALAGCSTAGSGEGAGSTFRNLFMYGGTTVPPAAPAAVIEVADCPPVTVTEGGAALRTVAGGGEGAAVRSQLSIVEVARECTGRPDGSIVVKVGVQVRALVGAGGGAARFDTAVGIVLKRGEQVLASRSPRVSVAVPPGQVDQTAVVVEDNFVVPPGGEFDIEVGLGGARAPRSEGRRKRARG